MMAATIAEQMKTLPCFRVSRGATPERFEEAQRALGTRFADEYAEYVKAYGAISFEGHELTGLCGFPRLDVVGVTREERAANHDVPTAWYVLEQTHMDDTVIWQAPGGEVYWTQPNASPERIADSLSDYLSEAGR